jgi:Uma2 family endonuclease
VAEVLDKIWQAEEFLAFERASEQKHELILGELYLMSGASFKHNIIASNLHFLLMQKLIDEAYFVFQSDQRVADVLNQSFCYPDITVIAGEPQFLDKEFDTITNPVFIAEVLSKGTQNYDKEKKFDIYKELNSLQEYLVLWQSKMKARLFRKIEKNHWEIWDFEEKHDKIPILKQFEVVLADIYRKVDFSKG